MNADINLAEPTPRQESRYAIETHLPGRRIKITSNRSGRTVLIEPGPNTSWQGPHVRISGHPRSMNLTITQMFNARWDPIASSWSVPKSNCLALRAYLAEHL